MKQLLLLLVLVFFVGQPPSRGAQALKDRATALSTQASAAHGARQREKAEALYLKALSLAPDHLPSLHNLGLLYKDQRKLGLAETLYLKVLKAAPRNGLTHKSLGVVYHLAL